jgi:hypothetical protein
MQNSQCKTQNCRQAGQAFRPRRISHFAFCILNVSFLVALVACRNDMHDQPRMKPLRRSDFFADAREGRPLLPGTVARGELNEDAYYLTGYQSPGQYGNRLPFPLTAEVLVRGQERFNIYCSPCHSRVGDGNGMIVQRGYRKPPSFHTDALRNAPLGHFYDVMTNGFGAMPDYAQQVPPSDRWAIAAYIRALQLAQSATVADVPENMRANIADAPSSIAPFVPVGVMGERATPASAGEGQSLGVESGTAQNPQAPANPQQTMPPSQQLQPGGTNQPPMLSRPGTPQPQAKPPQKPMALTKRNPERAHS